MDDLPGGPTLMSRIRDWERQHMRTHRLIIAVTLAATFAAPASAQRFGTIELGGFGQFTRFGDPLQLDNAFGGGGMIGFFVLPNVAVEADLALASSDGPLSGPITYRPWNVQLAYHIPLTRALRLNTGVGYTQGVYDGDPTPNQYEDAMGLRAGVKYYFSPSWAVNVDALFDKFPSPANQSPRDTDGYWNNSLRAGANWVWPRIERCVVLIQPQTATLRPGESVTFAVTARGEQSGKAIGGRPTFRSSDNAITSSGVYTASREGSNTITANYAGRGCEGSATARVTVERPPAPPPLPCVASINVTPDTATILRGESVQLRTTASTCAGADTSVTITYSGGDVDASGRFTAGTDTGLVTVTASATVGGRTITDAARIRVLAMRSTVVNFDLNKADVDPEARATLDRVVAAIRANPRTTIRVEGHADTLGTRNPRASLRYNTALSLARADSVTAYLLSQGIDRSRFEPRVRGYSFCAPAVPHRPPLDYARDERGRPLGERANRRVEVFELAMTGEEQFRWVCGGRAEPVTRDTPTRTP